MSGFRQVQSVDCAVLAMCSSVVILHSNAIVKQTNVVPLWTKQIPSLSLLPAWLYLFLQYLSSYLPHITTIPRNTINMWSLFAW